MKKEYHTGTFKSQEAIKKKVEHYFEISDNKPYEQCRDKGLMDKFLIEWLLTEYYCGFRKYAHDLYDELEKKENK